MILDPPITHVVYDADGLLLDTEKLYTEAYRTLVGRFGRTFDWSIKERTMGRPAADSARIIIEALNLPLTTDQWLEERKLLLDGLFPKAEPMPGAQRLTRHLHRAGIPQAIATSSDRYNFDLKTERHREWLALFQTIVSGEDPEIPSGKPSPDIFLVTAARMSAKPENCLVFEDAPVGVLAAKAAGMRVIAVPDPNMPRSDLIQADAVLSSLEQFDPVAWGLPGPLA